MAGPGSGSWSGAAGIVSGQGSAPVPPIQLQRGPTSQWAARVHQAMFAGKPVQRCGLCDVELFFGDLEQKLFDKYVCRECFMKPGTEFRKGTR